MAGGLATLPPLLRGEVWMVPAVPLPDRAQGAGVRPKKKLVVILQGWTEYGGHTDVAVVVASTDRRAGKALAPYEVAVGTADGFSRDSIIDGRWVFTLLKSEVRSGTKIATLSPDVMERVSESIVIGLCL